MRFYACVAACTVALAALSPGHAAAADPLRQSRGPLYADGAAVRAAGNWVAKDIPPTPPSRPAIPAGRGEPDRLAADVTRGAPDRLAADGTSAPPGMNLAELETIALGNNPTLVQAAMRVRAAQGKLLQAGLYPNPTIGYLGDEIGNEGRAGFQGARLGQEIVTGGKLQARSAVAAREIEQAEFAFQSQRLRVLNDVRSLWYDVLAAQHAIKLNEKLVDIGQQGVTTAEQLLSAKEVSRLDVLQARIEADAARLQLVNAQNRHRAVWRRLAAVAGTPDLKPAPLAGSLEEQVPELAWDGVLLRLWQESPELAEAHAGVRRARSVLTQQCAERFANVDLGGKVQYDSATNYTVAGVEVGMALPIFNRNQGNISQAQAQLVSAEREVRRVELALQERLAAVFEQYDNARNEVVKYAADILPNAQTSLDLVLAAYKQAQIDYVTLLTAQRTYSRVKLAYLESLRQYHLSRTVLDGLLLSGGLQRSGGGE